MRALLTIAVLSGCSPSDPERELGAEYVNAVTPLLVENRFLSEQRLKLASTVYDKKVPDAGFATVWNTEIIPLSTHLHLQAGALEVSQEWKDKHAQLITTWTDRTHAYTAMSDALLTKDEEAWGKARALHGLVLKREEAWHKEVEATLKKHDIEFPLYP